MVKEEINVNNVKNNLDNDIEYKRIYQEYFEDGSWKLELCELAASAALSKRSQYVKRPTPSAF